jgi:hypothetical protein
VGFSDRLRAWMKGDSSRAKRSTPTDDSSRIATKELEEFATSRIGVEAFLEPKTAIYSTTLLLVADDGEYLRRPVKDKEHAGSFAQRINIPLYDARKVGYPKRMRDYDQGKRPRRVDISELPPWPGDGPQDAAEHDGPPPPPRTAATEVPPGSPPPDADERDPADQAPDEPHASGPDDPLDEQTDER